MINKDEFIIRELAGGYWKGYRLDNPNLAVFGISKQEVIDKLELVCYDLCDDCDPQYMPKCNKCVGS